MSNNNTISHDTYSNNPSYSQPEPFNVKPITFKFSVICKGCWKEREFTFRGNHAGGMAHFAGMVRTVGQLNEMSEVGDKFCDCPPETEVQYEFPQWFNEWVAKRVAEHKETEHGKGNESGV